MGSEALKEETPVPVTATMDGRGNSGANAQRYAFVVREASPSYTGSHEALMRSVSAKRFEPYIADGASGEVGVARYALNIALSEALYPAIHCLEIAIRNSIHDELTLTSDRADWYDSITVLSQNQIRLIEVAKKSTREKYDKSRRSSKALQPDDIVAELPLGFWTAFFNKKANSRLASQLLRPVFRHAPRRLVQLNSIRERAERFRTLRNRVFHHERIVHWNDLSHQHSEIIEMLGWISPELSSICQKNDRFTLVLHDGIKPWL